MLSLYCLYALKHPQPQAVQANLNLPYSFASKVILLKFNRQGQLQQRMTSPRVKHFNQPNYSLFESPSVTSYDKNNSPWHLTSRHAKELENLKTINFWGQVKLYHTADTSQTETSLLTEKLSYQPQLQLATTQSAVDFKQPGLHVTAIGARAQLAKKRIHLLNQARGQYVPTP